MKYLRFLKFCFLWSLLIPSQAFAFGIGNQSLGLEDSHGKEVLPCRYESIRSISENLILAELKNQTNPFKRTCNSFLYDSKLRNISFKVPAGCTLFGVFLPDKNSPDQKHKPFPDKTIFLIHGKNGFGLCNLKGEIILEPRFPSILPPNGKYLYVFKSRNVFDFVLDIETGKRDHSLAGALHVDWYKSGDLLPFRFPSGPYNQKAGYASPSGKITIEPRFISCGKFSSEGIAVVQYIETGSNRVRSAYIDKSGKIISPGFDTIQPTQNGFSIVREKDLEKNLYGLIDKSYKIVVKPQYQQFKLVSDGMFAAKLNKDSPWIALDEKGKIIFTFPNSISYPENGGKTFDGKPLVLCNVRADKHTASGAPKTIFLNTDGTEFLKVPFNTAAFQNGRATAFSFDPETRKMKGFYINELGEDLGPQIPPQPNLALEHIPDLKLKVTRDYKFYPEAWKNPTDGLSGGFSRFGLLDSLLKEYDLLGMERKKIIELLGDNGSAYQLWCSDMGSCGNSIETMLIEYDLNDKVCRWGIMRGFDSSNTAWFDKNVIFSDPDSYFEIGRIDSKHQVKLKGEAN